MKKKVYILDKVHDLFYQRLSGVFQISEDFTSNRDELKDLINDAYGVIIRSRLVFDKDLIDSAPQLKFIARVGAGMESIDVNYAESNGIKCLNSPEGSRDAVAEQTTGMLLSLLNNLNRADDEVKKGLWRREENRGIELKDKTVGIIGFGNMGAAFAEKLKGFSCNIIAYDKYKKGYAPEDVEECSSEEIFSRADIVSIHIPLDKENYYFVDAKWLKSFRKPIILLNTSRGPVVKTSALVKAIENKNVVAAGLDVIEYEESSFDKTKDLTEIEDFNKLASMNNVILSPHIAGWTRESKIKLAEVLVNKILDIN